MIKILIPDDQAILQESLGIGQGIAQSIFAQGIVAQGTGAQKPGKNIR